MPLPPWAFPPPMARSRSARRPTSAPGTSSGRQSSPIASASIRAAWSCRRACRSGWRIWAGSRGRPHRHAAGIAPVATSDAAEYLDRCHAAIRALYDYWDQKRGGRRMPARSDIDPTEFVAHLPGIMLVDVVADERRYVYRLVGTREVEARGQDPTGHAVGEKFHGSSRENVLSNYDRVCRERRPLFDD